MKKHSSTCLVASLSMSVAVASCTLTSASCAATGSSHVVGVVHKYLLGLIVVAYEKMVNMFLLKRVQSPRCSVKK